ncbi:helix-turn-helix domain-containing protein [Hoeflea sp.]|uniref:helix-turn-helix domain-containing protein n=1 Tax=Hoeflea sp. TaxID=1940281 RepID=UPI003B52B6EA
MTSTTAKNDGPHRAPTSAASSATKSATGQGDETGPGASSQPSGGAEDIAGVQDLALAILAGPHRMTAANLIARQGTAGRQAGSGALPAGALPGLGQAIDIMRCTVVLRLVGELFDVATDAGLPEGVARRRPLCHMRQIAMYLSHVVLSVPYQTIGRSFGRDRSTVVHACAVVEDRRDDPGYDLFVERCERCVNAVFAPIGVSHEDR